MISDNSRDPQVEIERTFAEIFDFDEAPNVRDTEDTTIGDFFVRSAQHVITAAYETEAQIRKTVVDYIIT